MPTLVRIKPSYQVAQSDCGLACAHMVMQSYGITASLRKMRVRYASGRDGLSLSALIRILRDYGLDAKAIKCSYSNLDRVPLPAILAWNPAHYVVLEKHVHHRWRIIDPASGRRWCRASELEANFSGFCVVNGSKIAKIDRSDEVDEPAWKSLLGLMAGKLLWLAPLLLGVILVTGVTLAVPQITGWIVKALGNVEHALLVSLLTAISVSFFLVHLINTVLSAIASTTVGKRLTEVIYRMLLSAPLSYFNIRPQGELLYRISLVKTLESFVTSVLPKLMVGLIASLGCLIYVFFLDVSSFVLLATASILYVGVFNFSQHHVKKLSDDQNQEESLANSVLVDSITSIHEVKAGGYELEIFSEWANHNANVVALERKKLSFRGTISALVTTIQTFLPVGIFFISLRNGYTPDTLAQAVKLQLLATVALSQITTIVEMGGQIGETASALRRIDDLVNYKDTPLFLPDASSSFNLPIRLNDVSYKYGVFAENALSNISFEIPERKRIAIVGETGSGKSTLAKVIGGLLVPSSGVVLANNILLNQVRQASFYQNVSYVPQDAILRSASLRDNLTWGKVHSDDQLIRSLESAQFTIDSELFPQGLHTMLINGGANISGGQRQRISIARALLKHPKLLILDEATSGLDQSTEADLYRSLNKLDCAFVTVTHRLETVRDFDMIIVLDGGKIVETGTFESLLENKAYFTRMYFAHTNTEKVASND